jgi:hypothetical protein
LALAQANLIKHAARETRLTDHETIGMHLPQLLSISWDDTDTLVGMLDMPPNESLDDVKGEVNQTSKLAVTGFRRSVGVWIAEDDALCGEQVLNAELSEGVNCAVGTCIVSCRLICGTSSADVVALAGDK